MIINITNRQNKVSPAVRTKIESWLEHSQNYYDMISSAQITITKSAKKDAAEAILHAAGREIVAKASADNLYAALDALSSKVDRQLGKIKEKQGNKRSAQKPALQMLSSLEPTSLEPDMDEALIA